MAGEQQKIHFWTTEDAVKQIESGIATKHLLDKTDNAAAKSESRPIFIRTACEEECERYYRPYNISLFKYMLWTAMEEHREDLPVYQSYLKFKRDAKNPTSSTSCVYPRRIHEGCPSLYGYFSKLEKSKPKLSLPLPLPTTPHNSSKKITRGSKVRGDIKQEHIDERVSEELKASIKNICSLEGKRECDFVIDACRNRCKQIDYLTTEGPLKKRIKALIATGGPDYWLMQKIRQYRFELKSKLLTHYYYYKLGGKKYWGQKQI